MPGLIGNLPGAVGDAAKSIGNGIVAEARRVPVDIAKDTVEGLTGGAVDLDGGQKKPEEMSPEEIEKKRIKDKHAAARIAEIHEQLEAISKQKQQQEAQRRQVIEQQDQQTHMVEQKQQKSMKDRVLGVFMRKSTSKEGEKRKG